MPKKGSLTEAQKSVGFFSTLIRIIIRELQKIFRRAPRLVHKATEKTAFNSAKAPSLEYEFGCSADSSKITVAGLERGGNYPKSSRQLENQDN
jgi:hypothetical protein